MKDENFQDPVEFKVEILKQNLKVHQLLNVIFNLLHLYSDNYLYLFIYMYYLYLKFLLISSKEYNFNS